jgi:hypothetical protein
VSKPTDEILAALPEVGLRLWMLDEIDDGRWHAAVYNPLDPLKSRCEGEGDAPAAALIAALKVAGIDAEDDGS